MTKRKPGSTFLRGPENKMARLWRYVVFAPPDTCWYWSASRNKKGYPQLWWEQKLRRVSRIMHALHTGPVPAGLVVMHSCDDPGCVNPEHLSVGTHKANAQDREHKGRRDIRGERNPNYRHGRRIKHAKA